MELSDEIAALLVTTLDLLEKADAHEPPNVRVERSLRHVAATVGNVMLDREVRRALLRDTEMMHSYVEVAASYGHVVVATAHLLRLLEWVPKRPGELEAMRARLQALTMPRAIPFDPSGRGQVQ